MASNPTTPIAIRRNNLISNCDNNDVSVSRIPLPSPSVFRRSASLRVRGTKSCLHNATPLSTNITTLTKKIHSVGERIFTGSTTTISDTTNIFQYTPTIIKSNNISSNLSMRNKTCPTPTKVEGDNNVHETSNKKTSLESTLASSNDEIINIKSSFEKSSNLDSSEKMCSSKKSINLHLHQIDEIDSSINPSSSNQILTKIVEKNENMASTEYSAVNVTNQNTICETSSGGKRDTNGMTLNLNGPVTPVTSTGVAKVATPKAVARTPRTPNTPRTLLTGSLAKPTPKTPPVTPDSPQNYLDDDLDSIYSYSSITSGRSTMSCEHPYVARNGTTFSGRKMKYVVHCSSYAGQVGEDYLTPTQRAQRQLRRLKELLTQARQDLEQKDSEILRLTREVVELRLFKASLSSPEDRSNSSDAVTVREATTDLKTSQDVSPIVDMIDDGTTTKSSPRHILLQNQHGHVHYLEKMSSSEMQSSFADSGHFEDMTTSSVHSKDSYMHTQDRACGGNDHMTSIEEQRQELIRMYERRIEELIKTQDLSTSELKRQHNDKVEALLQKLAECNSRYADLVPDYEQAKERIRELEKQLEDLQRKLQEHEETQKKMYLHMYTKEQESERLAQADQMLELAHRPSCRVSISDLLRQLQSTQDELEHIRASNSRSESGNSLLTAKEAIALWVVGARKTIYKRLLEAQESKTRVDPEVTLQFLKSAIYYFLTDKENSQGHLHAIESILEFSEQEKHNINRARSSK